MNSTSRITFAEAIGTFVLVFGGVGAAVLAGQAIGAAGVALAFGLTLLVMAFAIGPITGCHINPAVTFGMVVARRLQPREAVPYVIGQVVGALFAALLLFLIVKSNSADYVLREEGFGANGFGSHSPGGFGIWGVMIGEAVGTALLVFVVLSTTDKLGPGVLAGIPIGLVLTLIHLVMIPVSNTSVNPARSLSQAVFVGGWALGQVWLFIVIPLVGGAIGAAVYGALYSGSAHRAPDPVGGEL